ncbi:hypothetical protein P9112_004336 [Eukaryota sp. TZLM1-RC]
MKLKLLEYRWHWCDLGILPIHSINFHPIRDNIFVTAGQHKYARIWSLSDPGLSKDSSEAPEFIAQLSRHRFPINTARFSPFGDMLLTAGDGGELVIWRCASSSDPPPTDDLALDEMERDYAPPNKEDWKCLAAASASKESDIYDAAWSPDEKFIVAGSSDRSVSIYGLSLVGQSLTIQRIKLFSSIHSKFVQGVGWDPLNFFIHTHGTDRIVRLMSITDRELLVSPTSSPQTSPSLRGTPSPPAFEHYCTIDSASLYFHPSQDPVQTLDPVPGYPSVPPSKLFSSELSAKTFFRRGSWSPDGTLLVLPTGDLPLCTISTQSEGAVDCAFVFVRSCFSRPIAALRLGSLPITSVSFLPVLLKLRPSSTPPLLSLDYRMVFAVASSCSLAIYDTQQRFPLMLATNVHPVSITDLAWSCRKSGIIDLLVSSRDGFLSHLRFQDGELGELLEPSLLSQSLVDRTRGEMPTGGLLENLDTPIVGAKRMVNDLTGLVKRKKKKMEDESK